jgi:hypothetical protein
MSWKNAIRTLMGVPYEYAAIDPVKPTGPVRRVVDPVDLALAIEEQKIVEIQRDSYQSFTPVLSAQDPAVQAVQFRSRFEPSAVSEVARRARALSVQQADAPVEPRAKPIIALPHIEAPISTVERWRRSLRAEQSLAPVMRKHA